MALSEQEIAIAKADVEKGNYPQAIQRFQNVLAQEPGNAEATHGLAVVAAHTDNLKEALTLACKAHELDETNIEFANTYNLIRYMSGDKQNATKALSLVANENPGDKETHINVAEMAIGISRAEAAYMSLEHYISHVGHDDDVMAMLGHLFENVLSKMPAPKIPG